MGIITMQGDILKSTCRVLTCPVNTVGVMGKGLALTMAKEIPGLLSQYRKACLDKTLTIDKPWVYKPRDFDVNEKAKAVLCFPTKEHWRNPSNTKWINNNLMYLTEHYETMGITSLALPRLGCGLGGLDWDKVKFLIYIHLSGLPINIELYEN